MEKKVDKWIQYLLHPSLRNPEHSDYRISMVSTYIMLLVFLFYNFYSVYFLLNYPIEHHQNVNNLIGYALFFVFFIILRLSPKVRYVFAFVNLGSLPLMYNSIYNTGGLYSSDIIWVVLITMTSVIFFGRFFGLLLLSIATVYLSWLYFVMKQNRDFFTEYVVSDHLGHYYFTWVFVLILMTIILLSFTKKMEKTNQLLDEFKARQIDELKVEVQKVTDEISQFKSEISKDFHDEMGNKLVSITVMTEMLEKKIEQNASIDDINKITKEIQKKSKELYQGTKDFIWTIDWGHDFVEELFCYLAEFSENFLTIQNINVSTNLAVKQDNIRLNPMTIRQLIFITKEILTNAAKHAECTEVTLDFSVNDEILCIEIADNGKGIDLSQHFSRGVKNINYRCRRINATCQITTYPEYIGTKYTIRLNVDSLPILGK